MDPQKLKPGLSTLPAAGEDRTFSMTATAESYRSRMKARLDRQRSVPVSVDLTLDRQAAVPAAIPAWLRSQVEQLAQRADAHQSGDQGLSHGRSRSVAALKQESDTKA